jgi:hypothetical protein
MTGGENVALPAVIALGVIALLLAVLALELQYQPRLRLFGRSRQPAYPVQAPPPEMKPSAIVRKPSGADKDA